MKAKSINSILVNMSSEWRGFVEAVDKSSNVKVEGVSMSYWSFFLKNVLCDKKVLVVSSDQIVLKKLSQNLDEWDVANILLPCSWSQVSQSMLVEYGKKLAEIKQKNGAILASFEEMFSGWTYQYSHGLNFSVGDKISFVKISKLLLDLGYTRVSQINGKGEFSIIGDTWLIANLADGAKYQINFDDTKIVSMNKIEERHQTSIDQIKLSGALSLSNEESAKIDLLQGCVFDVVLYLNVDLNGEEFLSISKKIRGYKKIAKVPKMFVGCLGGAKNVKKINWPISSHGFLLGGQENFVNNIERLKIKNNLVVTKYSSEFRKWVKDLGLNFSRFNIVDGFLPIGGVIQEDGLGLWSDRELFGWSNSARERIDRAPKQISFKKLAEFKVGDLVVHSDHGVGLLKDFITRDFNDQKKDYFVVAYSKGDLLYVPVEQLNKLSKYIGSKLVKINRLGGNVWQKRKTKARKQVEKMAKELLKIYAKRKLVKRAPYQMKKKVVDSLCEDFGYELTVDQSIAWNEIQEDMNKPYPMDRLLCGDVGFGKTELALRAAGRVAANRRQVAVLVPTTVLAEQHFVTFAERLGKYSIRVEVLSRLKDVSYQNNVLKQLAAGNVDVVIGTHRLLQTDVKFKDLGLLVIDEEQKFGVRAKEQLKKIRNSVDILSMSATPIPRTLNMSMGGMRDLSVLEVAPEGRQSINTQIVPYSDSVVLEAVNREVHRGGQVFIIHNRVRTITRLRDHLQDLLGKKVKIGIAHGKMSEKDLADTMNKFAAAKYDVLLATTIVENGLDLPNVNTLIVENAAGLGLSQLYQLRGRVGRSSRKAYAYFLYRSDKLKDKAKQRLEAISQAKELGSGMKLAVADMEIRGVGNVLGVQQHGNAYAVGLGVFLDMLNDMVERLKGHEQEDIIVDEQVNIDLPVSFSIPKYYIEDKQERLSWEQKLSSSLSINDVDNLALDLGKRHGPWPADCDNLIKIIKIRLMAARYGIKQIFCREKASISGRKEMNLILTFKNDISLDWVKYLFSHANSWVFRNNEAIIDVSRLNKKDWFDWFYKLLMDRG